MSPFVLAWITSSYGMCLLAWIYSFSSFVSSIKYEKKEKLQTQNTITLVLMFTCQTVMTSVISLDGFELFSNFLSVHPWKYSWASSGRQLALRAMNSGFLFSWKCLNFSLCFDKWFLKKMEELLVVYYLHVVVFMCVHVLSCTWVCGRPGLISGNSFYCSQS